MNRRELVRLGVAATAAGVVMGTRISNAAEGGRQFTIDLCPGRIGVRADQIKTNALAAKFNYESVEPMGSQLAESTPGQLSELRASMQEQKLVWGAAGLPVEFRKDAEKFGSDLKRLPRIAAALQRAGVSRVGTWLSPAHDDLTYRSNFQQHADRLRSVATILADYDLRFGLEYVGPRTLWTSKRYSFVHTMAETKELLAAIGTDNVGLVLDSWHWYTAEEKVEAILSLKNDNVVAVDLNDAPANVDVSQQIDNRRELPAATGVIDLKTFLAALVKIGYDGPIRAEPFNQVLNAMDDEPAVRATAESIRKAFALLG